MRRKEQKRIRLRDLRCIEGDSINYTLLMTEVFGYKNNWYGKKFRFKRVFKKAYKYFDEVRKIDPLTVNYNKENCSIVKPLSTDFISFRAMMELQTLMNSARNEHIVDLIAKTISIVCYQENCEGKYDSNHEQFIKFRERILDEPAVEMMGLYNHINLSLDKSNADWNQRFLSVYIEDKDYELAEGNRLAQFNVINTIKTICQDFNLTYDDAWQMSYNLVQTNSYSKATINHIQDQMRQIKEARMKAERKRNG